MTSHNGASVTPDPVHVVAVKAPSAFPRSPGDSALYIREDNEHAVLLLTEDEFDALGQPLRLTVTIEVSS